MVLKAIWANDSCSVHGSISYFGRFSISSSGNLLPLNFREINRHGDHTKHGEIQRLDVRDLLAAGIGVPGPEHVCLREIRTRPAVGRIPGLYSYR